jgi:hypothetical protein
LLQLSASKQMQGQHLKLGSERTLPHRIQFI